MKNQKIKYEISAGGIVYKKILNFKFQISNYYWLICQHSQHKGWVFPKGLVGDKDSKESIEAAALREVEEEGGVKAKIITNKPIKTEYEYYLTTSTKASVVKVKKTVFYFLMEYISGDPKNHDWEVSQAKFINQNEVEKILTYKSDKEAFEKALDFLDGLMYIN